MMIVSRDLPVGSGKALYSAAERLEQQRNDTRDNPARHPLHDQQFPLKSRNVAGVAGDSAAAVEVTSMLEWDAITGSRDDMA